MAAGTRKSFVCCGDGDWYGTEGEYEDNLPSSLLNLAVSNNVSPGPAGGSLSGTGSRCNAP